MFNYGSEWYGVISGIVSVISFWPYLQAILKGKTKPSGPSWWTWTFLTFITVISSRSAGATWGVLILPLWLCVSQSIVAVLSLKKGDNNWDFINKACIVAASIGIVLWFVTGEPIWALSISIAADFFASIPNLRHIWAEPYAEDRVAWTLGWSASMIELLAIKSWTAIEAGWAVYFACNMTITMLLLFLPHAKLNPKKA